MCSTMIIPKFLMQDNVDFQKAGANQNTYVIMIKVKTANGLDNDSLGRYYLNNILRSIQSDH